MMKGSTNSLYKFAMSVFMCLLVVVALIPMAYADNDTVALTYNLDGIICSKPSLKELKKGQSLWVNLAPEQGRTSSALSVKIGKDVFDVDIVNGYIDSVALDKMDPEFSYNPNTYYLLIPGSMVNDDVEITAIASGPDVVTYLVNQDLPEDGSIISSNVMREVATGEFTTTIKGQEPYLLTVTMADGMLPFEVNTQTGEIVGTGAIKDTDYIKYDTSTGELHITNIQANVRISAKKASDIVTLDTLGAQKDKSELGVIEWVCYLMVVTALVFEIYKTFLAPRGNHKGSYSGRKSSGSNYVGNH